MTKRKKTGPEPNRLTTPPKFRPLNPGKPLAPYRVPALKAFGRHIPGQGAFDFSSDDPDAVIYPDDGAVASDASLRPANGSQQSNTSNTGNSP